jgi:hypothetical protein
MPTRRSLALLSLTLLLTACRADSRYRAPHASSMKGWELYSWPGDHLNVWRFALLEGTNRVKTRDEIRTSPDQVKGLNALLRELDRLPAGEFVFWCAPRAPGQPATSADFPLPPSEYVDAAIERAEERKLVLAFP